MDYFKKDEPEVKEEVKKEVKKPEVKKEPPKSIFWRRKKGEK